MDQIKLPHQHLNAFHLDKNLLFQFILFEFLEGCRQAEIIKQLVPSLLKDDLLELKTIMGKLPWFPP